MMDFRQAEHPRPNHFLLHISDTHLVGGDGRLYGAVDSEARLEQIFEDLEDSGSRPEALVFTGDLADKGEPEAYGRLRRIVEPAAVRLGAQVIWAMGNHDDRSGLKTMLLDEPGGSEPLDRVYDVNGLRVMTLDSTVPGAHYGRLEDEQLQWLAEELADPAPHGTILAMHHPPLPSVQDLSVLVELRGQAELAEALRGSDVKSIIAGHLHYSTTGTVAGIPVSVASATCYTQDLAADAGSTRGRDAAQAYNMIHVYEETVVHSVVPARGGLPVGRQVTAEQTRQLLEAGAVVIPDAVRPGRMRAHH